MPQTLDRSHKGVLRSLQLLVRPTPQTINPKQHSQRCSSWSAAACPTTAETPPRYRPPCQASLASVRASMPPRLWCDHSQTDSPCICLGCLQRALSLLMCRRGGKTHLSVNKRQPLPLPGDHRVSSTFLAVLFSRGLFSTNGYCVPPSCCISLRMPFPKRASTGFGDFFGSRRIRMDKATQEWVMIC